MKNKFYCFILFFLFTLQPANAIRTSVVPLSMGIDSGSIDSVLIGTINNRKEFVGKTDQIVCAVEIEIVVSDVLYGEKTNNIKLMVSNDFLLPDNEREYVFFVNNNNNYEPKSEIQFDCEQNFKFEKYQSKIDGIKNSCINNTEEEIFIFHKGKSHDYSRKWSTANQSILREENCLIEAKQVLRHLTAQYLIPNSGAQKVLPVVSISNGEKWLKIKKVSLPQTNNGMPQENVRKISGLKNDSWSNTNTSEYDLYHMQDFLNVLFPNRIN